MGDCVRLWLLHQYDPHALYNAVIIRNCWLPGGFRLFPSLDSLNFYECSKNYYSLYNKCLILKGHADILCFSYDNFLFSATFMHVGRHYIVESVILCDSSHKLFKNIDNWFSRKSTSNVELAEIVFHCPKNFRPFRSFDQNSFFFKENLADECTVYDMFITCLWHLKILVANLL